MSYCIGYDPSDPSSSFMDSSVHLFSWQAVAVTVAVYIVTLAIYRLTFHPLAKFPGPKLAAITRYYEAYYDVIQNGQYSFQIAKMHKKYGKFPFRAGLDVGAFIHGSRPHWRLALKLMLQKRPYRPHQPLRAAYQRLGLFRETIPLRGPLGKVSMGH